MEKIDSIEIIDKLLKTNDMLLLYLGSTSCDVCNIIKPKVEEILTKYPKIKGINIELENSVKISSFYNIFTIPAVILFVDGKETIREARFINLQDLESKISRYYDLYY